MIVCICHRVSDRDIHRAVHEGCRSFEDLQDELRVATGCGACTRCAAHLFEAQVQACSKVCSAETSATCSAGLQSSVNFMQVAA